VQKAGSYELHVTQGDDRVLPAAFAKLESFVCQLPLPEITLVQGRMRRLRSILNFDPDRSRAQAAINQIRYPLLASG
jgi:hypothetical protein